MTAFKRAEAQPYGADRPIVASAARINIHDKVESDRMRQRSAAAAVWQKEAWIYYDGIGEIKFAYNLVAAVASRIRLYVGVVVDPNSPPVPIADALATSDDVDTGSSADDASSARRNLVIDEELVRMGDDEYKKQMSKSSVPQIMRNLVLNLSVPGEAYLVLEGNKWTARSTSEVKIAAEGGKYQVQRSRNEAMGLRFLKDGSTVGRVWREHPEYSMDPDSAMLGLRADCEELMLLSRVVRSTARASLNAGFLYVPDEVSVVARSNPDDGSEESEAEADPLETELLYTMTEPIGNENSAAGIVPMLLRGPAEYADKIKHIVVERKSDEFLVARAERVLERILQGLDVPKDIVTGLANVKYSNAIQIDESMYKAHVEPLALMICDAITDIVLHPSMRARLAAEGKDNNADLSQIVVWYDPSEVVTRPNRSADATTGYSNYLLSGAAWRDAHGFSDTDAPDEEEIAFRLAMEKAQVPEEMAVALFNALLPTLMKTARAANTEGDNALPPDLTKMIGGEGNEPEAQPVDETSVAEQPELPDAPETPDRPARPEEPAA
jgi:hypothetical protein